MQNPDNQSIQEKLNNTKLLVDIIGESWENEIILVVDTEFNLLYFNQSGANIFNSLYGSTLAIGGNVLDFIPVEQDREKLKNNYQHALSGIEHREVDFYGCDEDHFFETRFKPLHAPDESIIGVSVTSRDITEHKKIQEALKKSEFFFRESQKAALIGSYQSEFYPEDHWVTSEVCDNIFGMDENYNKTVQGWTDLLHPDFKDEMIRYVTDDVIGKGVHFNKEYKIIRQTDKETRWVWGLGDTIQDETGRTTGLIGTIQDVTDKKLAEEKINSLQEYLSKVIDNMPSVLIGIDMNYNILRWNNKAEKIYNTPQSDAIGSNLFDIIPEFKEELSLLDEVIKENKNLTTNKIETRNGTDCHMTITLFPIHTENESSIVIRIDDVTKEKELQKRLNQSQKMDAIGQLAGGIAHDFNNIITGIMGVSEILLSPESNLNDENKELVDLILKSSHRAAELTAKLLAFSRRTTDNYIAFDINSCIQDTLVLLKRTIDKRIDLVIEKCAENSIVKGDLSAIQNSIMNLAINASHAMENGGTLTIANRNVELDEAYCKVSPFDITPGRFIEVEVRDTGTGIQPEHVEKIFEPFFTTKEQGKGTGLGLAAVFGTMQEHHGAINVYSEVGTGTVFHLYLPCTENETVKEKSQKTTLVKSSGTILLIDDEEIIRATGKFQLQNMGFTVLLADNGKKGVELYRQNKDSIVLVITDMIMPEMYGSEAFRKIKEIDKNCKVVVSSGYVKDESLSALKEEGLAGFIQKPFRIEELRTLLNQVLG